MSDTSQQQSRIKELIAKGREQGYLTYAEVNDHLPEDISDPDQVEDIIQMINDMGINVFETAPDADQLLLTTGEGTTDEIAAAEAAAALAAIETEQHRTTDPVRMYMREMGTVELLTREGEIEIAKRIEEGIRELMASIAGRPSAVNAVLTEYDMIETDERKLTDIISGYLVPLDHVPSALAQAEAAKARAEAGESTEEDEEKDTGLDPEEARERFEKIRTLNTKAQRSISRNGWEHKSTQKCMQELAEEFKYLKLTPRQFDPLISNIRQAIAIIRTSERDIMAHCVRKAKMPRKEFIAEFPGNETN